MRKLLLLAMLWSMAHASYSISFKNVRLGTINSLATLKEHYIMIEITNPIARLMVGKDQMIYYDDAYSQAKNNHSVKYKKDRYQIIRLLELATTGKLNQKRFMIKKDKFITIQSHNKNIYSFLYNSKNRIKAKGRIEIDRHKLVSLIDDQNSVKIYAN